MSEVRNNGVPLAEVAARAGITQSIFGLADALSGTADSANVAAAAAAAPGVARWLNFWPGLTKAK